MKDKTMTNRERLGYLDTSKPVILHTEKAKRLVYALIKNDIPTKHVYHRIIKDNFRKHRAITWVIFFNVNTVHLHLPSDWQVKHGKHIKDLL